MKGHRNDDDDSLSDEDEELTRGPHGYGHVDGGSSGDDSSTGDDDDQRPLRGDKPSKRRKPSLNVLLLPSMFVLAIAAAAGLAWYHFAEPSDLPLPVLAATGSAGAGSQGQGQGQGQGQTASTDASTIPPADTEPSPSTSPAPTSSSKTASSSPYPTSSASPSQGGGGGGGGEGLIGYKDEKCGPSGAVAQASESAGPNGSEEWLNCGLSKEEPDSPWTPPMIKLEQLKTLSLEEALAMDNSVYKACEPYVKLFEKYAEANRVPPILLAAFAMQESSCNEETMGDAGGAFGLMQITEDKCGGAPGGNCRDPDYNIKTGAAYFAKVLADNKQSLLLALGSYNGWYDGLTYTKATAARHTSCCECQNNLDYHHAMLNGWMLGLDGSQMGTIRNIKCS
ncbi:hypothetical protein JCM10908_003784 [Rhodotorula pacifica]|uniref:uncharacterized protein n=1 Tax=Rhodotorula pacifica TaxID=1495444 RepID=UPI003182868F